MRPQKPIAATLLVIFLVGEALAQAPTQMTLGETTVVAAKFSVVGKDMRLYGGVTIKSPQYDAKAAEVKIFTAPGVSGRPAIAKITAEGDPSRPTQVLGHFAQPSLSRDYFINADHGVYVPDSSRPQGGRIDFTGHVKMTIQAPQELAGPSVTTADHITVLLGQGDDYPQIEGENGHLTFTPLQSP